MKASTIAILFAAIPALAFAETPDRFVRYVESTGSQYVDTGVTGRWNTRVEAQVEWLEFKQGQFAHRLADEQLYRISALLLLLPQCRREHVHDDVRRRCGGDLERRLES